MKAFVTSAPGSGTIELAEVPVPQIDANELLVCVHAIGVGIQKGDRVAFVSSMQAKGGTWAEFVAVTSSSLILPISGDTVTTERGIQTATVPEGSDVRVELQQLLLDVASGAVRVEIDQVYPFEEALAALAKVQTRHVGGTLVIRSTTS